MQLHACTRPCLQDECWAEVLGGICLAASRRRTNQTQPRPPNLCCAAAQEGRWAEALGGVPLVAVAPDTPLRQAVCELVDHAKHR